MIVDIINKKRLGLELSTSELEYFFNGYLNDEVKDYQMSSLLMAICIRGMSEKEIFDLTKIFIDSGDVLDFSDIPGVKVDKHSTGGVGDKTTLIVAPIVASLGVTVVKMSGRGLGHTGGTIDKLESIPGFRIDLTDDEFIKQVHEIGMVVTGQTKNLAPMDKKVYSLRDVTGTVSSIPLIAVSIMSKKIASGADKILIDVKYGNGALLTNYDDAVKLSDLLVSIGKFYNKEVRTIISDMNNPLGYNIGNSLEVIEAIHILNGREKDSDLRKLCVDLASEMVSMGKNISKDEAISLVNNSIDSGLAYKKFLEFVKCQGGILKLSVCNNEVKVFSKKSGKLESIDALGIGKLSVKIGAGRENITDKIDYGVGIVLNKKPGSIIKENDLLCTIYTYDSVNCNEILNLFKII